MPGDNFGFSFIADIKRTNLQNRVHANGLMKKYKHKAKTWLAMGRDITDPRFLVNEFAYLDSEWKHDAVTEEIVKKHLSNGRRVDLNS